MPNVVNPQIMQSSGGGSFWDTLMQMGLGFASGGPIGALTAGANSALGGHAGSAVQGLSNLWKQHGISSDTPGQGGAADNPGQAGSQPTPQLPQQPSLGDMQNASSASAAQGMANPQSQTAPPGAAAAAKPQLPHQTMGLPDRLDTATLFSVLPFILGGGGGNGFMQSLQQNGMGHSPYNPQQMG